MTVTKKQLEIENLKLTNAILECLNLSDHTSKKHKRHKKHPCPECDTITYIIKDLFDEISVNYETKL